MTLTSIEITSCKSQLPKVDGFIASVCSNAGIDEEKAFKINLCLTEAVTNAIVHGNKEDKEKVVKVSYASEKINEIVFKISDQGGGFNPGEIPDPTLPENIAKPNGRGVYLINQLCECVGFEQNGSTVRLTFNL